MVTENHNPEKFFLDHLQSVKGNSAWYYCQKFLGKGGNGTAFLVTCSSGANYGMQFVLKVFHKISDANRREAFLKEVEHLKILNHPGIIKIYDEGLFQSNNGNSYPFAVIEYMPTTVRQLMISGELDRLRVVRIALNCMSALNAMHTTSPQLVHRDIKPENILIAEAGAKIADFGLVKTLDDVDADDGLDGIVGTQWPGMPFRYRTPEMINRAIDKTHPITTASDIYQFGTVLYELLTNFNPQKEPVGGITVPIQLELRMISGAKGQELYDLVTYMLANDPAKRPTAATCIGKLNLIHQSICKSLCEIQGESI